jgi:hypothetical protein
VTSAVNTPDFITIVTNVGVFLAASGTVIAAIWSAVKKIRTSEESDGHGPRRVVGGTIMDHSHMMLWSESNRTLGGQIDDLTDEMRELRFAVTQLKDKL